MIRRHRGVRNEFWRLTKDDPRFDTVLQAFLGQAYSLKEIADYETGPEAHISVEMARAVITTAQRFVASVVEALGK